MKWLRVSLVGQKKGDWGASRHGVRRSCARVSAARLSRQPYGPGRVDGKERFFSRRQNSVSLVNMMHSGHVRDVEL